VKELSDQMRGVVFVVAALLILVVWQHFYKPLVPPPPKPAPIAATSEAPDSRSHPVSSAVAPAKPLAAPAAAAASAERSISIDSPLYHVELSNRGAVVKSWKLKKYLTDDKPPRPLDLVNPDVAQQLGWPFSLQLADKEQRELANMALYQVTPARSEFQAPVTITFHWSDGHLDVSKKLTFDENYQVAVEVAVALDGKPLPAALAWRGGFGDRAVEKESTLVSGFYYQGGKLNLLSYKKLGVPDHQDQPALQPGPLDFAGIEDQFFTATFLADGSDLSLWHWMQQHSMVQDGKPAAEPVSEIAVGTAAPEPLHVRVFVGPKDLAILSKVNPRLEELVNFGWTGIIAKPLLFALQWLHKYIPNYGWAIVALTLIINFLLFPLKIKSWRSMQKMQKVTPEVRAIQDRYKKYSMSDPRKRKMNEEVMAIYQREGINPMGSCLPMVFQMPIWWALWRVLTGAIELRHAPWLGWIHDLSAKDPYYILPIAMTITMYLMTKMTPQTAVDPTQQKMTQLMPLMFAVIFFSLSSGLNLYMFTSNLVGVGQQLYLNKNQPLPNRSKFKKKQELKA
jgi:YidC/Oxa1 family membrane protein insertase